MQCDLDCDNAAVMLVSNLGDGDTLAICADHIVPWCQSTMSAFGVTTLPHPPQQDEPNPDDDSDEPTDTRRPRPRGARRVAMGGARGAPPAVAEEQAEDAAR